MQNKHFIPPIIEQWIDNLKTGSYSSKAMYASYLEKTMKSIETALAEFNSKNKNDRN